MISTAFTLMYYVGVTISLFVQTKTAGAMGERKGGGKTQPQIQKQANKQTKNPTKTRHSLRFESLPDLHAHALHFIF